MRIREGFSAWRPWSSAWRLRSRGWERRSYGQIFCLKWRISQRTSDGINDSGVIKVAQAVDSGFQKELPGKWNPGKNEIQTFQDLSAYPSPPQWVCRNLKPGPRNLRRDKGQFIAEIPIQSPRRGRWAYVSSRSSWERVESVFLHWELKLRPPWWRCGECLVSMLWGGVCPTASSRYRLGSG